MAVISWLKRFSKNHLLLGPFLWTSIILFVVIQFIAASATKSFNFVQETLSDLGNTACGTFDGHYVCSPLHSLINISFIILGVCIMAGSVLICFNSKKSKLTVIGFTALFISGIGIVIVGLSPENINEVLHYIGAGIVFTNGFVSMVALGQALQLPRFIKKYAIVFGYLSLVALIAMAFIDFDRGFPIIGIVESLVTIPQILWILLLCGYMFHKELHKPSKAFGRKSHA